MKTRSHHPRDSGGTFRLDNPGDGTPIREMFALEDGLFLITEKCTYKVRLADQIDPDRKTDSLPHNFQQKLFDHGISSPLLGRTLLQAKIMFRKEFQRIDILQAMRYSIEALENLVSMDEISKRFIAAEQAAIENIEKTSSSKSMTVPSVGNVRADCKSYTQKADHFAVALMGIVRLFYPEMLKKHWDDFRQLVADRYGAADDFTSLLAEVAPFLKLIRDTRDCLEHTNLDGAKTSDFAPQTNGSIARPMIEVSFRKSSLPACPISAFMTEVTEAMQHYFELVIVHMCDRSAQPFAGLPLSVGELSPQFQKAWGVRYGYGSWDASGQFIPCG